MLAPYVNLSSGRVRALARADVCTGVQSFSWQSITGGIGEDFSLISGERLRKGDFLLVLDARKSQPRAVKAVATAPAYAGAAPSAGAACSALSALLEAWQYYCATVEEIGPNFIKVHYQVGDCMPWGWFDGFIFPPPLLTQCIYPGLLKAVRRSYY